MFIAIPECLKNVTTDISPQHWRIQAIKIQLNKTSILIVNSYLPNDSLAANPDDMALTEVLEEIRSVISGHTFDQLYLLGDLNTDFSRRTGHVRTVNNFIKDLGLIGSWDKFAADFSHISEYNGRTFVSLIDHFLWNSTATDFVSDCGILHLLENSSDHCPIFCKFVVNTDIIRKKGESIPLMYFEFHALCVLHAKFLGIIKVFFNLNRSLSNAKVFE